MLRVDLPNSHHFRLVIRHPDRILDLGIRNDLGPILDSLSDETLDELRSRFAAAQEEGLRPTPLRHVHEDVDFWRDDFWNFFG